MPPQIPNQMMSEPTQKCPWYQPLCQVTPVSKYLAMVIFVTLPFVGGYVGYKLAPEKVVEVSVVTPSIPIATSTASAVVFLAPQQKFTYESMVAKFTKSKDTLRFGTGKIKQSFSDSDIPFDFYENYSEITGVSFADQNAADVSSLPYLDLVATTSDYMLFSAPIFIATEGSNSGLYKYDTASKVLGTMESSSLYNPFRTSGIISPDKTKIAVVKYPAFTLGFIDIKNDTFTAVKTFSVSENKLFAVCEMGCDFDIRWIDTQTISAKVFEFERCGSDGVCTSVDTDPQGRKYENSTYPIATSTMTFPIN